MRRAGFAGVREKLYWIVSAVATSSMADGDIVRGLERDLLRSERFRRSLWRMSKELWEHPWWGQMGLLEEFVYDDKVDLKFVSLEQLEDGLLTRCQSLHKFISNRLSKFSDELFCSCLVCTLMMPVLQVLEANQIVGQNPIACQRTLETYIQTIGAEDDEEAVVSQLIQVEFEVHYVLNILRVGTTGE